MTTQLSQRRQTGEGNWRLRNWRVRARLVALILIPTAAAVLLGGIQVLASTSAAGDYARTNQFARLSEELGALTHAVSGERARMSWYIARNRPASALSDVQNQMDESDLAARDVRAIARELLGEVTGRTADQLEQLLNRLDDLIALRKQALEANLLPGPAVELYTTVIADLLATHNELIKGSSDDELFRQTRMLDALARVKESVAYQQALVTVVLTEGAFDADQLERFLGQQAGEAAERRAFAAEATAAERRFFDETVNGNVAERMLFLRELVLIRSTNGLPLRGLDLSKKDDAREWFEASKAVVDAMRTVEKRQAAGILARSGELSDAERRSAWIVAAAVLALLVAVLLVTTGVARSMVRPLRRLRSEALEIAGHRLPAFVQHLRESRDGEIAAEVPPIGIFTKDEVGELARAFDEVHREAVRLAGDEARLRSNVNAMFVNLSRRSQTLVERQLTLIEKLERGERDDTRLADLFKLDHLATRMRRNSENLLVLAGQEAARRWSEPVEIMDIVRAALGEVESYDRVSIQVQSDVAIAGQAVTDVVHLLAELVENAVSFSSRDTKVIISSSRIDGGALLLSVTDNGISMTQEELAEANHRLANPPVVDVSVSRRMGLFVVGRLALRHNIRVQLRRQDVGGLTAMVLVPPMLLTAANGALPGQPQGHQPGQQHSQQYGQPPMAAMPSHPSMASIPVASPVPPAPPVPPVPRQPAAPVAPFAGHPSFDAALPEPSSWFSSPNTSTGAGTNTGTGTGAGSASLEAPHVTGSYPSFATPLPSYPPEPSKDEFLPIFASVEDESSWFSKPAPTADHRERDPGWSSPADTGWQAASTAAEPVQGGTTSSGLPKRTPRANLVPGTANPQPPPAPAPPLSPDRLRSRLASYQQGVRKGRSELEEDS
ncbi:nitrate- and nitrite sensing domain-containing protein [Nonomuraea sp. LP-02]|uniref:sensor histidine kinase n=1 Tax=Nonomuraea sp. LP-02 TaxID=3097960 RepID=UPI002E31AD42|nr:nitrate- and nitrite sensing domain-containing protein [Nonomuraea sp. LP-02]MED7926821.1 nitrate- and nitrite sensing domain-containing protein [Nonomuraea sp. LP-02]